MVAIQSRRGQANYNKAAVNDITLWVRLARRALSFASSLFVTNVVRRPHSDFTQPFRSAVYFDGL